MRGTVQGGGLEGSVSGSSEVDVSLLGLTLSGDSSNISESTSVGLDDSILSTGYGTSGIRGESLQSIDTLSSTEYRPVVPSPLADQAGKSAK